jgi:hypothetical protein
MLSADELGNVRTETTRGFTVAEMEKLLAKVDYRLSSPVGGFRAALSFVIPPSSARRRRSHKSAQ